jgi:NAD(P)-dependent dehydrogenase (short-subunit alcohol dehydrogenase family)
MDIDLSGRRALVSGSTKGIGRAIAAGLAGAGAAVVVNGREDGRVTRTADELRKEIPGADVSGVAADLATAEGATRLFEHLPEVDILVNNLGIFGPQPVLEIDDDEWRRYFEVNVLSGVRLARHYLPGMTRRGWGRVQFIASDSAIVTPAEMVHYGMTKTALLAEGVEDFVAELVGADLPWDEAQRKFMAEHRPNSLLQRLIEPDEIANMVVYLSSEAASATTGGAVRVDGGYVDSILP